MTITFYSGACVTAALIGWGCGHLSEITVVLVITIWTKIIRMCHRIITALLTGPSMTFWEGLPGHLEVNSERREVLNISDSPIHIPWSSNEVKVRHPSRSSHFKVHRSKLCSETKAKCQSDVSSSLRPVDAHSATPDNASIGSMN